MKNRKLFSLGPGDKGPPSLGIIREIMDLKKDIKSIVITYSDENCVRLTGDEALKFKEVMQELVSVYAMSVLSDKKLKYVDLNDCFNYEVIRPSAKIVDR